MLLVSTGFKSLILGPHAFADIFAGGSIRIFAGARRNSADHAEPSSPIAVIRNSGALPGLTFVQDGPYVLGVGQWQIDATAPGTATWFSLVVAGDDGADTLSRPRVDGDIGSTSAPSDMTLANTTLSADTAVPVQTFVYTIPPLTGI